MTSDIYLVVDAELEDAISVGKLELSAEEAIFVLHRTSYEGIKSVIVNLDVFLVEWDPLTSD